MRPATMTRLCGLASLALVSACWGRGIGYEGDTATAGGDGGVVTECGDESLYDDGWRIEGTALYQDVGGSDGLAGLCITAIDPTPALTGSDPEILASSAICDDGSFVIASIQKTPAIGVFVVVDDCDDSTDDEVMISATGISGSVVEGLGDGGVLNDVSAAVVTNDYRLTIIDELKSVGYDGAEDETFQFLGGRLALAGGDAADDHTLTCGACEFGTNYADADLDDGLFTTGSTPNASSSAAADAFFLIPMASIGTYTCADSGGTDLFTNTYGALPGYGVFIEVPCVAN
jgi:hypothetical protein